MGHNEYERVVPTAQRAAYGVAISAQRAVIQILLPPSGRQISLAAHTNAMLIIRYAGHILI